MNEVPPDQEPDDTDRLYRRAAAQDDSRPSELVRRRVLQHAAELAAQRAAPVRTAKRRWRGPATVGTLAAATLAGLIVIPRFFTPGAPPMATLPPTAEMPQPSASPQSAAAPQPAALPPAAQSRLQEAPAPATQAAAASAANRSPVAKSRGAELTADAASVAGAPPSLAGRAVPAARAADPAAELRRAAEIGDIAQLQAQIANGPADARDQDGRTALMLAVLRGQSRAVEMLLASGADPNAADAHGTTPLQAALAAHQQAIAETLQRAGAR